MMLCLFVTLVSGCSAVSRPRSMCCGQFCVILWLVQLRGGVAPAFFDVASHCGGSSSFVHQGGLLFGCIELVFILYRFGL